MSFVAWLLADSAARGDALALADDRGTVSHAVLHARVRATAARLRALIAIPRAIVPIFGESSIDLVIAYLGAMWAGHLPALVPPMSRAAQDSVLAVTGAQLVLADAARAGSLVGTGARVIELAELATSPTADLAAADLADDAPALLLFTSGSTGAPRGVALSTRNLVTSTREILAAVPVAPGERALSTLPVYYCYGTSIVHTHLHAGGAVIFAFGFPQDVVARIGPERIALLPGVPGLFEVLARRSTLGDGAVPRRIMISGGRTSPATMAELRRRMPHALISLRYGVTELTAAASFLAPELVDVKLGSIGRGLPSYPLAVVRPDGSPVAPDEPGEIVATGPHVALGYHDEPDATRDVFVAGGFRTGDDARIDDDGFIYVLGRRRDFIKSAGHRISPHEIEDVIATHPAVAAVAVTSQPDPLRGEVPVALIVLCAGATIAPGDIELYCRATLPAFKIPVRAAVVADLPRTASGKVRRELLAAIAATAR